VSIKLTSQQIKGMMNFSEGICESCWETTCGMVEPDAEGYECGCCGKNSVYGIDQAILLGIVEVSGDGDGTEAAAEKAKGLMNGLEKEWRKP